VQKLTFSLVLAIAAGCGSGSSSTPRTTPTVGPDNEEPAPTANTAHDHHEHHPPSETTTPADPPEPAAPDPAAVKAELLAAETTAFEQAKPVFDKFCSSCHVQGGKQAKKKALDHFDMTRYPFGGHHAGEITATVRKSLAIDGGKATMPKNKPGSVPADQVALIAAWADAFDASHAGGAHEGMPGHDAHGDHGHGGAHKH
jgi:hypothetical protein